MPRGMTRRPLALLATLALAGCNIIEGDGARDEVIMSNVEVQPGTVSDDIVPLEQSQGDLTAVDPSTAVGPPVSAPSLAEPESVDGATGARASGSAPVRSAPTPPNATAEPKADAAPKAGDTVIRPPAPAPKAPPAKAETKN